MVGIFCNGNQTLIIGLDVDDNPIDKDGIVSGPDSKIDLNKFELGSQTLSGML